MCGGFGGVALWVAIFPADVCKSRIQVLAVEGVKAPTFISTITSIIHKEGNHHHFLHSMLSTVDSDRFRFSPCRSVSYFVS